MVSIFCSADPQASNWMQLTINTLFCDPGFRLAEWLERSEGQGAGTAPAFASLAGQFRGLRAGGRRRLRNAYPLWSGIPCLFRASRWRSVQQLTESAGPTACTSPDDPGSPPAPCGIALGSVRAFLSTRISDCRSASGRRRSSKAGWTSAAGAPRCLARPP